MKKKIDQISVLASRSDELALADIRRLLNDYISTSEDDVLDLNERDSTGKSPLFYALSSENVRTSNLLMQNGALLSSISEAEFDGILKDASPKFEAYLEKKLQEERFKGMCEAISVDLTVSSPENIESLREMLDKDLDLNLNMRVPGVASPLFVAAFNGNTAGMTELMNRGATFDSLTEDEWTEIHKKYMSIVDRLDTFTVKATDSEEMAVPELTNKMHQSMGDRYEEAWRFIELQTGPSRPSTPLRPEDLMERGGADTSTHSPLSRGSASSQSIAASPLSDRSVSPADAISAARKIREEMQRLREEGTRGSSGREDVSPPPLPMIKPKRRTLLKGQ